MRSIARRRILLIDDDALVRAALCDVVTWLGYEVDAAADGAEGLALLDQGFYDIVVTDLVMPGLSGWDVLEQVRKRVPVPGMILLSGTSGAIDADRARAWGLLLLAKPASVEALGAALSEAATRAAGQA